MAEIISSEHQMSKEPDEALTALNQILCTFWKTRLEHSLKANIVFAAAESLDGKTQSGMILLPNIEPGHEKLTSTDIFDTTLNAISTLVNMLFKVGSSEGLDIVVIIAAVTKAVAEGFKLPDELTARLMAAVGLMFLGPPMQEPKGIQ